MTRFQIIKIVDANTVLMKMLSADDFTDGFQQTGDAFFVAKNPDSCTDIHIHIAGIHLMGLQIEPTDKMGFFPLIIGIGKGFIP